MDLSHGGAPCFRQVYMGEVAAHGWHFAHLVLGCWTLRRVREETHGREESREKGCLLILEEEEAGGMGLV